MPIGDILPWLEKEFHSPNTSQRVITRFTESNVNLAKPFEKIIERAGLTVWPKLIQNLRGSCETEWLDAGIPAHVVARWIGHSVKVQNDNYAQVDDHHFEQFNQMAERSQSEIMPGAQNCPSPSTVETSQGHRQGQQTSEMVTTGQTTKTKEPRKTQGFTGSCESLREPSDDSSTGGGGRTRTWNYPYRILNPARLPFRHSGGT